MSTLTDAIRRYREAYRVREAVYEEDAKALDAWRRVRDGHPYRAAERRRDLSVQALLRGQQEVLRAWASVKQATLAEDRDLDQSIGHYHAAVEQVRLATIEQVAAVQALLTFDEPHEAREARSTRGIEARREVEAAEAALRAAL